MQVEIEALVSEALEAFDRDGPDGLESVVSSHPEHAATLREAVNRILDFGLLESDADVAPSTGKILGDFELGEVLGGGGMGVVYRARQHSLDREVALKLIRFDRAHLEVARQRFAKEAKAIARLHHANIVPVHAFGEAEGTPFLAMELLDGRTVAEALARLAGRKPDALVGADLSPGDAPRHDRLFGGAWVDTCLRVVRDVAAGVAHAHSLGVIHRDIKPSNIMLTSDDRVLLFDFGLMVETEDARLTGEGAALGSPAYMAPEQHSGNAVDERTDVYGLGVTLYEMLTLELPFMPRSTESVHAAVMAGDVVDPRHRNRHVAWDVETVCLKAMDRDPQRRYQSAAEFAEELTRLLEHEPIVGRRPGRLLKLRRFVQRHPTGAVGSVLGLLLLVGLPSGMYWAESEARAAATEERDSANEIAAFLAGMYGRANPAEAGTKNVRAEDLLDYGARRLAAARALRPRQRIELRLALGEGYLGIGQYEKGTSFLRSVYDEAFADTSLPAELRVRIGRSFASLQGMRGEHRAAVELLDRAMHLAVATFGERHESVAGCLAILAEITNIRGEHTATETHLQRCLDIRREIHGADSLEVAKTEVWYAGYLVNCGRRDDGERVLRAVMPRLEKLGDPAAAWIRTAHVSLAWIERENGDLRDALESYEEALRLGEHVYGPDHPILAKALELHGGLLSEMNQPRRAEALLDRALKLRRANYDEVHPGHALCLNQLAGIYMNTGRLQLGLQTFERSCAIYAEVYPDGHRDRAIVLGNLADAWSRAGDANKAIARSREAVQMLAKLQAGNEAHLLVQRQILARLLALAGERNAAKREVDSAARLVAEHFRADSIERALHFDNRAFVSMLRGDVKDAHQAATEAVAIFGRIQPEGSARHADALGNLGWTSEASGLMDAAKQMRTKALAMYDRFVPEGTAIMAFTVNALGIYAARADDWKRAAELLRRAYDIRRRCLPESSPLLAGTCCSLGVAQMKNAELTAAERTLRRAVELRRKHLPPDHIETAHAESYLGEVLVRLQRAKEAVPILESAVRVRAKHLPADSALLKSTRELLERARKQG